MNNLFSFEEEEDLQLYLEQANNLEKSRFLRFVSDNEIGFKWRISRTEGASFIYTLPDEEAIKAFVVDFSQIFLKDKQPANFHHICNILQKKILDDQLKQQVIKCREYYTDSLNKGVIDVILNGKKFSSKETVTDWLMGYYRHTNKENRAKIQEWVTAGGDFYKFHFLNSLVELTKPILEVAVITKKLLTEIR